MESNFRTLRFTRSGTLSAADRCYTATLRNNGRCKDILSAVEFARGADTAAEEKPFDTDDFPGGPTFSTVRCRAGEINGERSSINGCSPNVRVTLKYIAFLHTHF